MAIDNTNAIDVSRLTEGVYLSPQVSADILADVQEQSVIQTLAQRVSVPSTGEVWQTITGEPEAQWVGETQEKPVSRPTFGNDAWKAYKTAVIVPFSEEFLRDSSNLFAEVKRRLPGALSRLFDRTVLGLEAAPGEHFDQFSTAASVEFDGTDVDSAIASLVDVEEVIADAGGVNTGYGLVPSARVKLMRFRDSQGRGVFTGEGQSLAGGSLLGAPVVYNRTLAEVPNLMGVAADWTAAQWGSVDGIHLDMSRESTLTEVINVGTPESPEMVTRTLNLWQRNMVALRVEAEFAFKMDADKAVRLTDAA